MGLKAVRTGTRVVATFDHPITRLTPIGKFVMVSLADGSVTFLTEDGARHDLPISKPNRS